MRRIPLGALQEREFRLFFTDSWCRCSAVTPFALASVLDLTGSARDLGFVIAAKTAPLVIFLLVGGAFADRLLRRGVMLTADVARMAVQAATAALLLSHTAHLGTDGAPGVGRNSDGVFQPRVDRAHARDRERGAAPGAHALRGMSMGLTQFAGPALAASSSSPLGRGALAVDAVSFAVSAFYLARLHLPLHVSLPPQSFARDLLDGWRDFIAPTWDWLIVVSASLGNMTSSVWLVLAAAWIKNGHGGAGAWRVILVVSAIGGLAAGATALRLKPRRPVLLASIAVVPNASPIILLALKLPWETLVVTALVTGFGNRLFNTLWETTLQQHIPPASLSRVSAYDWYASQAARRVKTARSIDSSGLSLMGMY